MNFHSPSSFTQNCKLDISYNVFMSSIRIVNKILKKLSFCTWFYTALLNPALKSFFLLPSGHKKCVWPQAHLDNLGRIVFCAFKHAACAPKLSNLLVHMHTRGAIILSFRLLRKLYKMFDLDRPFLEIMILNEFKQKTLPYCISEWPIFILFMRNERCYWKLKVLNYINISQ